MGFKPLPSHLSLPSLVGSERSPAPEMVFWAATEEPCWAVGELCVALYCRETVPTWVGKANTLATLGRAQSSNLQRVCWLISFKSHISFQTRIIANLTTQGYSSLERRPSLVGQEEKRVVQRMLLGSVAFRNIWAHLDICFQASSHPLFSQLPQTAHPRAQTDSLETRIQNVPADSSWVAAPPPTPRLPYVVGA